MKWIHNYRNLSNFVEEYNGTGYTEPWVSYVKENTEVDYNKRLVNFAPLGEYDYAHFDLTPGMVAAWAAMMDNEASVSEFNVKIGLNNIDGYERLNDSIRFYSGRLYAYIGINEDFVTVGRSGDGGSK